MTEYYVIFDLETGEPLIRGSGPVGSATIQQLPEGAGIMVVPQRVLLKPELDLAALRDAISMDIDSAAEQVRSQFVTALPAQVGTYLLKEAAARAWLADHDAPTFMLQPEATARGMTIADLAAEVVANAEAWARLAGAIEGLRFAAKTRIAAAATIGAIAEAAVVDWEVLHAPAA